jgi:hypothetical protein
VNGQATALSCPPNQCSIAVNPGDPPFDLKLRATNHFPHNISKSAETTKTIAIRCSVPDDANCEFIAESPGLLATQSNVHGAVQFGRVYWQNDVWMAGIRYSHAVGMHAPATGIGTADFQIPVGSTFFRAIPGLARLDGSSCSGDDSVAVYVDGVRRWGARLTGSSLNAVASMPRIDFGAGSRFLRLEVNALGNSYCAHTTWGDPYFGSTAMLIADSVSRYFLGQSNVHGGTQFRRVYWTDTVVIAGVRYKHAIGMHAPGSGAGWADFAVPASAQTFETVFGYARDAYYPCSGVDEGRIYLNGALKWIGRLSGSSLTTSTSVTIPLPASAQARVLRLEVDALGDQYCAQTTWGNPYYR